MKKTHEYRGYVFTITYQPKEPAYTVDFPDWPDIITSGDTLAEAFRHASEALDLHLESLQKLGQRWRKPKHRLVVERRSAVGRRCLAVVDVGGTAGAGGQAARRTDGMGNAHGLPVGSLRWPLHALPRVRRQMPTACPWDRYVLR